MANQQQGDSQSSTKGGNVIHNQEKSGQEKSGQGQRADQSMDKRNDPKRDSTRNVETQPDRARHADESDE